MKEAFLSGQPIEVRGSAKHPYKLENKGGVFSCTCPSWRNQSVPIDRRSCKHLKVLLGATEEEARVNGVTADTDRAAEILANAKGRKLRPDEKAKLNGPPVMLAHPYDQDIDPTGWWFSEKLDGVRAYWDGKRFISRQGNTFHAPDWFKAGLPDHPVDGELYGGRRTFEKVMGVVRRLDGGEAWRDVSYKVFDLPILDVPFEHRLATAATALHGAAYASVLDHGRVLSREHLYTLLREFEALGAEGLMIRRPGSLYDAGRSWDLLKVKHFKDAEARVIGYEPGKGRHKGRVGALTCMMPSGVTFELGAGLSDKERDNPPPIGSWVTYSYTELTSKGKPKCTGFIRVRPEE